MTVDNVTQILNKIPPGDKWEKVMDRLVPLPLVKEIKRRYSTDTEKNHVAADYFVNCHPQAEWELLTSALYFRKELASARESKLFMSTGNYCTMLKLNVTFLSID